MQERHQFYGEVYVGFIFSCVRESFFFALVRET